MYDANQQIVARLQNLIKKGYVSRETKSDSGNYLNIQITTLGKVTQGQVIFPYGMNAMPPANTLGICFNLLASEDMVYFIPFAMVERFKNLKSGEVKIGSQKHQNFIYFKEDGSILIESKDKLDITASGDINLTPTGKVNLGVGGQPIARLGDEVTVNGDVGTITSAGTNTSA